MTRDWRKRRDRKREHPGLQHFFRIEAIKSKEVGKTPKETNEMSEKNRKVE